MKLISSKEFVGGVVGEVVETSTDAVPVGDNVLQPLPNNRIADEGSMGNSGRQFDFDVWYAGWLERIQGYRSIHGLECSWNDGFLRHERHCGPRVFLFGAEILAYLRGLFGGWRFSSPRVFSLMLGAVLVFPVRSSECPYLGDVRVGSWNRGWRRGSLLRRGVGRLMGLVTSDRCR